MRVDVPHVAGRRARRRASASRMQSAAPRPPGDGAVMWWASQVEAAPSTSPYTVAPRGPAPPRAPRAAARRRPRRCRSRRGRRRTAADSPVRDSAVIVVNAATVVGVMDDSAPPASTASQRPSATMRAPAATECVPAAQAVVSVSHGPRQPCRSDTAAAPGVGHDHRDGERRDAARARGRRARRPASRACRRRRCRCRGARPRGPGRRRARRRRARAPSRRRRRRTA